VQNHKVCIDKFQNIEIIKTMFSDLKGIMLEVNNKMITRKSLALWKLF
jgi:hypothetical protein